MMKNSTLCYSTAAAILLAAVLPAFVGCRDKAETVEKPEARLKVGDKVALKVSLMREAYGVVESPTGILGGDVVVIFVDSHGAVTRMTVPTSLLTR